jgi:hypothetical protein
MLEASEDKELEDENSMMIKTTKKNAGEET